MFAGRRSCVIPKAWSEVRGFSRSDIAGGSRQAHGLVGKACARPGQRDRRLPHSGQSHGPHERGRRVTGGFKLYDDLCITLNKHRVCHGAAEGIHASAMRPSACLTLTSCKIAMLLPAGRRLRAACKTSGEDPAAPKGQISKGQTEG